MKVRKASLSRWQGPWEIGTNWVANLRKQLGSLGWRQGFGIRAQRRYVNWWNDKRVIWTSVCKWELHGNVRLMCSRTAGDLSEQLALRFEIRVVWEWVDNNRPPEVGPRLGSSRHGAGPTHWSISSVSHILSKISYYNPLNYKKFND